MRIRITRTKVHQILQVYDVRRHLAGLFGGSDDLALERKLEHVVELFPDPDDDAIVLSIDEWSHV